MAKNIEEMDVYEAINHIGWQLGVATGYIKDDAVEAEVNWNELLDRTLELIDLGHRYEGLDH